MVETLRKLGEKKENLTDDWDLFFNLPAPCSASHSTSCSTKGTGAELGSVTVGDDVGWACAFVSYVLDNGGAPRSHIKLFMKLMLVSILFQRRSQKPN